MKQCFIVNCTTNILIFMMTLKVKILLLSKCHLTMGKIPQWFSSKESSCNAGDAGDVGSIPESGRSPGGRNGHPPSILAGKIPRQRSLANYSPQGRKELDMTEHTQKILTYYLVLLKFYRNSVQDVRSSTNCCLYLHLKNI